jgi:CubicO group peptidase (beta-lactamase class C family)
MVHHLLTHTSGLRDEDLDAHAEAKRAAVVIPPAGENQHPRIHESLFLRYDAPLWKPPGVEMSYCSYGYALLGEIVRRVSGQSLAGFATERIFGPLGMKDTLYIVPDAVRPRIVRRGADALGADILDSRWLQDTPQAEDGAFSTALDLAVFTQTFLNGGRYGAVRLLSPAAVAEMTRNHIPGISSYIFDEVFPEASWGLGWSIKGPKKAALFGSLLAPPAFEHPGWGGTYVWGDPAFDLVGVYLSVVPQALPNGMLDWHADLFINATTAAVDL